MHIIKAHRNAGLIGMAILTVGLFACNHMTKVAEKVAAPDTTAAKMEPVKSYDIAMVDNKKDPTCGMPVTAGIGDTVHYKSKVIGFCSAECKAEFAKNPEAGLIAADLKTK